MSAVKQFSEIVLVFVNREGSYSFNVPSGMFKSFVKIDANLPESKDFFKRIKGSLGLAKRFVSCLENIQPDCIQAEGLDCLFYAWWYAGKHKVKIFYQVSDVREVLLPQSSLAGKIKGILLGGLEAQLLKKVTALVVTSERFYEMRYARFIDKNHLVVWHNFPDFELFRNFKKTESNSTFRVGFVGSVRYQKQLRMLVDATEKLPNVMAVFSGSGKQSELDDLIDYCEGKDWVEITGPYKYEVEICDIYARLDCIYAVYDSKNENVKIALPNKLYEAIYCGIPIVVAKGTYLSELVEEWGVGLSVSDNDPEELVEAIRSLKEDSELRETLVENCCKKRADIASEKPSMEYRRLAEMR